MRPAETGDRSVIELLLLLRDTWHRSLAVLARPLFLPAETVVSGERAERRHRLTLFGLPPRVALYGAAAALLFAHTRATGEAAGSAIPLLWLAFALFAFHALRRTIATDRATEQVTLGVRLGVSVPYRTIPFTAIEAVAIEAADEAVAGALEERDTTNFRVRMILHDARPINLLLSPDFALARAEAHFFALALRKPLVERLLGPERTLPPEELAMPWLERIFAAPAEAVQNPAAESGDIATTNAPLPTQEPTPVITSPSIEPTLFREHLSGETLELSLPRRALFPGMACAAVALAATLSGLVGFAFASDLPGALPVAGFLLAVSLIHASRALVGHIVLRLTPETIEVRDRFVYDRRLYVMRFDRLRDLTVVGGRRPRLCFLSGGGLFALPLPELAARALLTRIKRYAREGK